MPDGSVRAVPKADAFEYTTEFDPYGRALMVIA
jgi:hypothetical protein